MITVAFVLPSFAYGGAERVCIQLIRDLDRRKFDPRLIVFDVRGELAKQIPDDVPLKVLGKRRLRHALPDLVRAIRKIGPAITVSTLTYVNLTLAALRPLLGDTKLIVREASTPTMILPQSRLSTVLWLGSRLFYRRADCVIVTSRRAGDEVREFFHVPDARISILPNPVDVDGIRGRIRAVRRVDGGGPRFVAAGRLQREKGFDRLLEMFAYAVPGAHLTILGDGPDREALQRWARQLEIENRIYMPGFTDNPWEWFAGADAVLVPSRWEGMPNVALEALACGAPVIATPEAGGIAELADETGGSAVRVCPAGSEFIEAMNFMHHGVPEIRPSLLPPRYDHKVVNGAFAALLEGFL